MSAQDWLIFFGTFSLFLMAFIVSEVQMFRKGADTYSWAGKLSRAARKVGL